MISDDVYSLISAYIKPTLIVLLISAIYLFSKKDNRSYNLPPKIPHYIPFIGSAISFGQEPTEFLQECAKKYGECFTFKMIGRNMTVCMGEDGNNFVFNIPIKKATAEGAYRVLTRPVFGDQVVYDVDNQTFMEQKKFVKDALSTEAFRSYVPLIMQETKDMVLKEWKENDQIDLFYEMSELTIRTASRCLMGQEIRDQLHSNVAKWYTDLDRGFTPLNVFVENLPLPRFIKRDIANREMTKLFLEIMEKRRAQGPRETENFDVLEALMTASYKSGKPMGDVAVAHMMIALLMAGQHTSSTTSTWMLFRLAQNPELIKKILEEQSMVLTGKPDTPASEFPEFTLDTLKECTLLDLCLRETLRLHPPIHFVMRMVEEDIQYKGMDIPKGHFLCSAIMVGHLDEQKYPDPKKFDPYRHKAGENLGEWSIGTVDIQQKSAKNLYLPFGAGRHRCIGEHFAFIQNKAIVATLLRYYDISLPKDANGSENFPPYDFTQLIVLPKSGSLLNIQRKS